MRNLFLRLVLFLLSLLASHPALAGVDTGGVLDEVSTRFFAESAKWGSTITGYASWLFWTLATISMVWTFGMMALRKADIGEFFAELCRFTIFTGFFWWLLEHGPTFAMDIINSLRTIGAQAGGVSRILTPSAPIDIAFEILVKAGKSYSYTNPIDNLSIFLTTLAVLACMAVVAANVLLALVSAWVMAYAGVFVLGFGGSRWTSDIALNYFRAVAGIALKLMTMTLLIGIALSIMEGYHQSLQAGAPIRELLVIFVVALVLVVLIHSIPNVIAGLMPGGGQAAGSGSSFSAGALFGAAAGAGAAVASSGATLAAGAASAAGGAPAIMSAFSKANENMSAGTDVMSAFSGGGSTSSSGWGGGSDGKSDAGSGGTPFAQAAGFGGDSFSNGGGSSGGSGSGGSKGDSKGSAKGSAAANDKAASASASTSAAKTAPGGAGAGKQGTRAATVSGGDSNQLMSALGRAGRIAADAGANLAMGAVEAAKSKGAGLRDTAADRIANTTGGRIAAAIHGGDEAGPTFGDNSLAAAPADADSEIAAFANRKSDDDKKPDSNDITNHL